MKLKASAVAVLLARDEAGERVTLVGMRHPKSSFLAGYFAFPGGAHDPGDGDLAAGEERALRRTAARELAEETGIAVAPESFVLAGRRVTPPFTPRGFDSLFFVADVGAPAATAPRPPEELVGLEWVRPADLVRRWRALEIRVAPPVLPIVHELARAAAEPAEGVAARLARVNEEMEADGPRIEFVPDVLMIPLRTATLLPATHTNGYLVGSRELAVIDPGCTDAGETARLLRHVRRREAEGTRAGAVLLTHHHADHVGAAAALAVELGVPVLAHAATHERLALPGGVVRRELRDGERVPLEGGERLQAMHTPGHAPGHLAFLEETRGSLFAGDLLSGVSTILVDDAPGSLELYLASIARIRDAGARTLFPGHGPPLIDPARTAEALLEHRRMREERILAAVRGGAARLEDIAAAAYADTPGAEPALARAQARAHLDRLGERGLVDREGGEWRARS